VNRILASRTFALATVALLLAAGCLDDDGGGDDASERYLVIPNYDATQTIGPDNEITLAVNPTDPLNLIGGSKDYFLGPDERCGQYRVWSGVFWSRDGGVTWNNSLFPGYDDPSSPLGDFSCISDPVVVFGPDGTAYYSGLAYADSDLPEGGRRSVIWVARSDDGGATWADPVYVTEPSEVSNLFHDKQWVAVDQFNGDVYVTWSGFTRPPMGDWTVRIFFSRSTDGGASFDGPVPLSEWMTYALDVQGSQPVVGPDGTLHVMWNDYQRGQMRYTRSYNRGLTWEIPRSIGATVPLERYGRDYRTPTIPMMAVDASDGPHSGNVYIVWEDQRNNDPDVMLLRSTDGGDNFDAAVVISDDGAYPQAWQFFGWIDVDEQGWVHLIYYDDHWARDTNASLLDVAYRLSTDGSDWSAPLRLTPDSFDPLLAYHQTGTPFIGDYNNIDAINGTAWAGFADTRTGASHLWVAEIPVPLPGEPGADGRIAL